MFRIGEINIRDLDRFGNMLGALGQDGPKVMTRALNRTGSMARTRVVRELVKQTGLPQKTIRKAVKFRWASSQDLEYSLKASGGDVSLKYFKARETRKGVIAFVRGKRELFEGMFIKGGSFARGRVVLEMHGQVFERIGSRTQLEAQKSGVFIPIEMAEGKTLRAFEAVVADVLPRRLDHEINRSLGI